MEAITIVLRSGMGMQLASVRPYLKPGTPIAIGRGGAVIAEVSEGNAVDDKRQAAEAAAGYIDSVESRLEGAESLELVVGALERTLLCIEKHAVVGQNGTTRQATDALGNIRELAAAFLDNSGARAEPAYPGAAAARRPVDPGRNPWGNGQQTAQQQENEHWRNLNAARYEWLRNAALDTGSANVPMVRIGLGDPLQGVALDMALNEAMTNWPIQADDYYAHDAELLADPLGLAEHADEFNAAPAEALKPSIFDVITGTACVTGDGSGVQLPPVEEHLAQVESVGDALRDEQMRANQVTEALGILERWVEKAEYTDGYVGVVEIEAVEIVADELRRLTGGEA